MALSDRERRLLAEMEAALASDDPRLQSTLSRGSADTATLIRKAPKSALAGVGLVVAGIAILFTGLVSQIAPIGIAGFIVSLSGLLMALRGLGQKGAPLATGRNKGRSGGRSGGKGSFGARLQDRWDQRDLNN